MPSVGAWSLRVRVRRGAQPVHGGIHGDGGARRRSQRRGGRSRAGDRQARPGDRRHVPRDDARRHVPAPGAGRGPASGRGGGRQASVFGGLAVAQATGSAALAEGVRLAFASGIADALRFAAAAAALGIIPAFLFLPRKVRSAAVEEAQSGDAPIAGHRLTPRGPGCASARSSRRGSPSRSTPCDCSSSVATSGRRSSRSRRRRRSHPSTFFRYFPSKEDVVLFDALDPWLIESFQRQSADLTPIAALRAALHDVFASLSDDVVAEQRQRARLVLEVPALQAAWIGRRDPHRRVPPGDDRGARREGPTTPGSGSTRARSWARSWARWRRCSRTRTRTLSRTSTPRWTSWQRGWSSRPRTAPGRSGGTFGDAPGTSRRIRGQPARCAGTGSGTNRAFRGSSRLAVPGGCVSSTVRPGSHPRCPAPKPRPAGGRPPTGATRSSVPIHQIHGMMTVMTE